MIVQYVYQYRNKVYVVRTVEIADDGTQTLLREADASARDIAQAVMDGRLYEEQP